MALSRHTEAASPLKPANPVALWLTRHATTARQSLARILAQAFSSFMIVLVIAVTLALPAALNLVVKNARAVSGSWDSALDFSVFLAEGVSLDAAENLRGLIAARADVEAVVLISADEALAMFKQDSGFGAALDQLADNPLPHTLVVRPSRANTEASIQLLREELSNLPETEHVQIDTEWVQRFHAILDIVRQAVLIGAVLFGAAIIVVIGNTIRLDIQNRREEIEVTKLIGASNGFVRRPFLWTGFWFGLLGALLAVGLVAAGARLLEAPVARLMSLYQSGAGMQGFSLNEIAMLLAVGIGLGLTGSWFAAARHMRAIEPR